MNALTPRSSLFDDFFKDMAPGFFVRPLHGDALPSADKIRIDVIDEGDAYRVHADVPGVAKEDIHVHVDGNTVTLLAQVNQHDQQQRNGQVVRSERYRGTVSRAFSLAADLDKATAKARFENGVLTLNLPKAKAAGASRLNVE